MYILGPDKVRYTLRTNRNEPVDEIEEYWKARYLTAGESTWRIMGFHLAQKEPAVTPLPIHLPNSQRRQYKRSNVDETKSLLQHYFLRPNGVFILNHEVHSFDNLLYADYYTTFCLCKYNPSNNDNANYFKELHPALHVCQTHVVQRNESNRHLSRIQNICPTQGEIFYLRCILQRKAVRSFEDARTVNGSLQTSFQTAATQMGIFADENEGVYALHEAVTTLRTPQQLRLLFTHLLINDCLPSPLQTWNDFRHHLAFDFYLRSNNNTDIATTQTLQELSRDLEEHGFTLNDYGLPEPETYNDEVEHELQPWSSSTNNLRLSFHCAYRKLNEEQRELYDRIIYAISNEQGLCQFIDGKAGRGKTFLVNTLCDRLRSEKKIVLATATSAFAAQQFTGGRTTHSTFKVCFPPQTLNVLNEIFFRSLSNKTMRDLNP